jgi:hypothetical protein
MAFTAVFYLIKIVYKLVVGTFARVIKLLKRTIKVLTGRSSDIDEEEEPG